MYGQSYSRPFFAKRSLNFCCLYEQPAVWIHEEPFLPHPTINVLADIYHSVDCEAQTDLIYFDLENAFHSVLTMSCFWSFGPWELSRVLSFIPSRKTCATPAFTAQEQECNSWRSRWKQYMHTRFRMVPSVWRRGQFGKVGVEAYMLKKITKDLLNSGYVYTKLSCPHEADIDEEFVFRAMYIHFGVCLRLCAFIWCAFTLLSCQREA